jgi:hypothetical protein
MQIRQSGGQMQEGESISNLCIRRTHARQFVRALIRVRMQEFSSDFRDEGKGYKIDFGRDIQQIGECEEI